MATSGGISKQFTPYNLLSLTWERTSYDVAANTSTIKWELTLHSTSHGELLTQVVKYWALTIDGMIYQGNAFINIGNNETKILADGTQTIKHNGYGIRSFMLGFEVDVNITFSGSYIGNVSQSGTATLDAIPYKATVTRAPNFTDEDSPTIGYTNPAGEAVSILQAGISLSNGSYMEIAYRDIDKTGNSYTFNFTDDERDFLRNYNKTSNTLPVRYYIRTYFNGDGYLYSAMSATMTIVNGEPVISPVIEDSDSVTIGLTGDKNTIVKYYSDAKFAINAVAKKGATIASYKITCGNRSSAEASGTLYNVQSGTFDITVTDSRGNTVTQQVNKPFVEYVIPTCTLEAESLTTDGTLRIMFEGNQFSGSFGSTINYNRYQYRLKAGDDAWGEWQSVPEVTTSGHTYSVDYTITGLDYTVTYKVQARHADYLKGATESSPRTLRAIPIFDWGENDFNFNVPVKFNAGVEGITGGGGADLSSGGTINGDLTVTGNLRLKGSGNYGNTLYFGDGSYATMSEPSDDTLTIKATNINLNGNVNVNGSAIGSGGGSTNGTWTPTLNSSAISSYTVRQGWYQQVGNVVTLGFNIKATCNSGYNSTSISISGVPVTPRYDASGGGMCSGAFVSAGFNFECWVVSTGGSITGRVQSCNNTNSANLSTSASGLFYRSGGGEITLSGTICYITN